MTFVTASLMLSLSTNALARTFVVNRNHAAADDAHSGTELQPLKTINRAAQLAQPGDTVVVHGGIYRERVTPARGGSKGHPIVYMAAHGEEVIIKGSEVWEPEWIRLHNERPIYRGAIDPDRFRGQRINPYRTRLKGNPGGQQLTLGQVFVDAKRLREVDNAEANLETPATWRFDNDGLVIHFPHDEKALTDRLVELTIRERIFAPRLRGLGYIHVKGFTMEHCANQFPHRFWESDSPQAGALGCRSGHHWMIERNTIRFAKSIGIDCGYEGRHDLEGNQPTPQNTGQHVIRGNVITDNGCCGIAGMRSLQTRILHNVVARNNSLRHSAPEAAGIKLHYFIGGRLEGNLIRNNDAHGIWIDNVYRHARITRNVVVGNHGNGIFIELGEGPILIDHNVVGNTRAGFHPRDPRGDGLYSHDASGITFAHNLVFGSHRFGSFHLKATKRGRAGASNIRLFNNIFIDNQAGNINLPAPGPDASGNQADRNLYSQNTDFVLNPWGGVSQRSLIKSVERVIGRRPQLWLDAAPRLSFLQWQQVTGWDHHSVEASSVSAAISDEVVLTLDLENTRHATTGAVRIPEVEVDFFGWPIPPENALAGPFQQLSNGKNRLLLWDASRRP